MEEATSINWSQVAAQSGILIGFGGIVAKLIWSKITSEIQLTVEKSEEKVLTKMAANKEQLYKDINGLSDRMRQFDIELAVQKQTDARHDKELEEARRTHKDLDVRFNNMVEKIFLKIEELKDLIITKYTRD